MKILLAGLLAWPVLAYAAATHDTGSCPATSANDYPTAARSRRSVSARARST